MDKYDQILDLIEHPESYSSQEIKAIMADSERRELYNLLSMTGGAFYNPGSVDVEAEWRAFSRKNFGKRNFKFRFGSRAASIVGLVWVSAAALAIGTVVAMKVISNRNQMAEKTEVPATADEIPSVQSDTIIMENEAKLAEDPVLFEDETLDTILKEVSAFYGKELYYAAPESAGSLRLYYRWNPALPLEEVIEQLNTFGQINLRLDNAKIIVDKP